MGFFGGSGLPATDTTAIVQGSADPTKQLRFEVDGFTTGQTRVLTPPDADTGIAGTGVTNMFTAGQTVRANAGLYVRSDSNNIIIGASNDIGFRVGSAYGMADENNSQYNLGSIGISLPANLGLWFSDSNNAPYTTKDLGLVRAAAGVAEVNTGTPGVLATLRAANVDIQLGGVSAAYASAGGSTISRYADVGNVGTGEDDLYSDTLAANTLATNGDSINGEYAFALVNSTSTKRVRLYFAGTAIFDTGALTLSASGSMIVYVRLIRVSNTVVRYTVSANTSGASTATYAAVGELTGLTLSATGYVLKVTGETAGVGTADNDVVAKSAWVDWMPAA